MDVAEGQTVRSIKQDKEPRCRLIQICLIFDKGAKPVNRGKIVFSTNGSGAIGPP